MAHRRLLVLAVLALVATAAAPKPGERERMGRGRGRGGARSTTTARAALARAGRHRAARQPAPAARQPAVHWMGMEGAGEPDHAGEMAHRRLLFLAVAPTAAAAKPGERVREGER